MPREFDRRDPVGEAERLCEDFSELREITHDLSESEYVQVEAFLERVRRRFRGAADQQ